MAQVPQRNLPPESTQWAKWVEKQIVGLDSDAQNNARRIARVQTSQQHLLTDTTQIRLDQETNWDIWELEREAIVNNIEEQLNDPQQPITPTISSVTSEAYWDESGQPRADASVTWLQVRDDVNNEPLTNTPNYEVVIGGLVQYVPGIGDEWADAEDPLDPAIPLTPEEVYNTSVFSNLPANTTLSARVRSLDNGVGTSEWSEPYTFTTTALPMELLPPSAPTFRTENGAIEVIWDGKLDNGEYPPAYFSYCLVQSRKQGDPIWTNYGQSAGWVLTGLTLGDVYEIRLIAVDTLGRQSEPSETSYVTVKSQAQEAANAAANAEITANGLNARLQHNFGDPLPTVRSNATPLVNGDEVVTWKDGNAVQVQVWNGSSWVKSYLLSGEIFVLSEQGAISLSQGVVDTPQLKAGAIDSFKITSPLIQSVDTENRGIKWNGNTLVGFTNIGTEAFRLDGTKATITAGTIQTAASGARVVLDTDGLKAYNASGVVTTDISGALGTVSGWSLTGSTITGGTVQTATSGQRIVINSQGLQAYNALGNVTASILSGVGSFTGASLSASNVTGGTITGSEIVGSVIKSAASGARVQITSGNYSTINTYDASNTRRLGIGWNTQDAVGIWLYDASGTTQSSFQNRKVSLYDSGGTVRTVLENGGLTLSGANSILQISDPAGVLFRARYSDGVYARLRSGTGGYNVKMSSAFVLFYESSAEKTKLNIEPLDAELDPYRLLEVSPVEWLDRHEMAEYVDARDWQATMRDLGRKVTEPLPEKPKETPGLVLEDMLAHGLDRFTLPGPIQPDGSHGPGTVLYDKAWLPLIPIVRDLLARINILERSM